MLTEIGPVQIEVPRDRDGSFTPQIVGKRQRRLDGIDQIGHTGGHGVVVAVRAAGVSEDPAIVAGSFVPLVSELQHSLERGHR